MGKVYLLFAIHSHQPVGNFEDVFDKAVRDCYGPFIEMLEAHPRFRLSLHYSGPLLEWIEAHAPTVIDRIRRLVQRGQVEMLSGGFYEPLLPYIPQRDVRGQTGMMNRYCERAFGQRPRGFWLTERVWDPVMPLRMDGSGLQYTIVDDTHLFYAGLAERDVRGYYVTERAGRMLAVFPTHKRLRYLIPFRQVEETLDFLRGKAETEGEVALTYGDDGEKFGVWPGTRKWVFEEGWLERFLTAIEAEDWIETLPLGEYLDRFPPTGRAYMPTASYEEMTEWALPVEAQLRYQDMLAELERLGKREVWHPFIRAGIWDNFLVKYSESNLMHKRMLWASHGLQGAGEGALRELYRGQCNCAYWHGLFGGLYLKHLRQAVYHHLILAERLHEASRPAGWCNLARCDYDRDGRDEIVVANADLFACLAPESGGCLLELDYKPRAVNLTDTLTRRKEAYHRGLLERHKPEEASAGGGGQPLSIHERMGSKEEGLDKLLVYDTYDRRSFLDHLLAEDATPDSLRGPEYAQGGVEEGDFIGAPYTVAQQAAGPEGAGGATVRLERVGSLRRGAQTHPVRVAKTFNFGAGSELVVDYEVGPVGPAVDPAEGPLPARFAVELNLSPVGDSDDAVYYVVEGEKHPGGQSVEAASVGRVALIDERLDYRIEVGVEPRATAWLWPLETVSQSDEGFERNRQGTVLLLSWTVDLQARQSFRVRLLAAPAR